MNVQSLRDNRWALVPVALLSAMLLGLGWMAALASNDPGFALERDYYAKAIRWDQQRAQQENDVRLGYRLEVVSASVVPAQRVGELTLRLLDAYGGSLRGAQLNAEAFALARSASSRSLHFEEVVPGTYRTRLEGARAGLWELRCTALYSGERFTHTLRVDLVEQK